MTPTTASTVTTTSGVYLAYDSFGDPAHAPLLLIQGLGAQMIGWHPEFCQRLADKGYHVIRHDNRDVGESQKFPGGGYTLQDMARDSAQLLTSLGLTPAHVVGQSMGGMIAQQIAIGHPQAVQSLCLIYTEGHNNHLMLEDALAGRRNRPQARNSDEAAELYLLNESHCASAQYPNDQIWLRELGRQMYDRDNDPEAVERQLAAIYNSPDRRPALPYITAPTAIPHGDHDRLIDQAAAAELHRLIPGSSLTIYAGLGHSVPRRLWDDIITRIQANAARVPNPSPAHPAA